jgi:hypothetical protein
MRKEFLWRIFYFSFITELSLIKTLTKVALTVTDESSFNKNIVQSSFKKDTDQSSLNKDIDKSSFNKDIGQSSLTKDTSK